MTHTFKLSRRAARFRAPMLATLLALALGACAADELTNTPTADLSNPIGLADAAEPVVALDAPSSEATFAGGIPFGNFAQPLTAFGTHFNGAMRNIAPNLLVAELVAVKARGGKTALMFAGNERHYKTNGYFDLAKWKARINRYRDVNFTAFINDGTVIGHYLIDEPNDPANWRNRPVPPSVLEEMARHSKQLWPNMTTIVRVEPTYLGGNHRYLDAAWAQYLLRKGPPADYVRRQSADAQAKGLGLVVGMNLLHGGNNRGPMTAGQVRDWGTALLSSTYPCAFISWTYNSNYLAPSGMRDAMRTLRGRAQNRSSKTCRA